MDLLTLAYKYRAAKDEDKGPIVKEIMEKLKQYTDYMAKEKEKFQKHTDDIAKVGEILHEAIKWLKEDEDSDQVD